MSERAAGWSIIALFLAVMFGVAKLADSSNPTVSDIGVGVILFFLICCLLRFLEWIGRGIQKAERVAHALDPQTRHQAEAEVAARRRRWELSQLTERDHELVANG